MIAAGAIATVIGSGGQRQVPVEDIVTGPGQTSLAKDEVIVSFLLPNQAPHSGDCYMRLTPRTEMDIAVVGVGASLTLDDSGTCTAARVSLGAVAPTPLLVQECADALIGTKVDEAALTKLGEAASAACNPISDKRGTKEYRIKTAAVIARRVVEKALERAKAN
jgi:carbon-monoxide dehydrogenase medium subunit